jgi:hypothetical protein
MRRDHCALTLKLSMRDAPSSFGMYGVVTENACSSVAGREVRMTPAANGIANHL